MIAIPALDLRDNACVQLVGGSYDQEKIRLNDPAQVAENLRACGFRRLHVVDLDAATGRGSNAEAVSDHNGAGGGDNGVGHQANTGGQVTKVPVGSVDTGDGSTIPGTDVVYYLAAGALMLVGAAAGAARLLHRQS